MLLKATVLLGMVHSVTASVPPPQLSCRAKRFSLKQEVLQQAKCLSDTEQENTDLRGKVCGYVNALAAWQQWADDLYSYHRYLEDTRASLDRDFCILRDRHELLKSAHASLQEEHLTCKVVAALAQPSVAGIWSSRASSVGNDVETIKPSFCAYEQLGEPVPDLVFDPERMGDQES